MLKPEVTLNYKLTINDLTKAIKSYMVEEGAVIGDANVDISLEWADMPVPLEEISHVKVSISKEK